MPRSADPSLLGGLQLPLDRNPLQRISYRVPNIEFDLAAFMADVERYLTEILIPALKQLGIIDLTAETGLLKDLQDGLASILTALAGIDLTPGGVIDAVQAIVTAIVQTILNVIGDVIPVVGTGIEGLGEALLSLANQTIDNAQGQGALGSQIGSLQNQINVPQSSPIPVSLRDGEIAFSWKDCNADLTITPTTGRGSLVRIKSPDEKRTVSIMAYKLSGVTGIYFDGGLYDPAAGTFTRMYQSSNEAANLSTGSSSADYQLLQHEIPADQALVVNNADMWAWLISTTGGNIVVRGWNDANIASPLRPYRTGFVSLLGRLPATVDQPTADAAFNSQAPYIEFDRARVPEPLSFFDNFEGRTTL